MKKKQAAEPFQNQPLTIELARQVRDHERYVRKLSRSRAWEAHGAEAMQNLLALKSILDNVSEEEFRVAVVTLMGSGREN